MDVTEEDPRFIRCEPDDPHRCQGVGKSGGAGQCIFLAAKLPDGTYGRGCVMHGATIASRSARRQAVRLYDIQKYKGDIQKMLDAGEGIYLTEELAVLRMTLSKMLERYTDVEFVTGSGNVSQLVGQIRDTLVANQKLESKMGALLDRQAIDRLCDRIVAVVSVHVAPDKLDAVCSGIAAAVADAVASRVEGI